MEECAAIKEMLESEKRKMTQELVQLGPQQVTCLLHPPLPLAGVSIGMQRGCQHNDSQQVMNMSP